MATSPSSLGNVAELRYQATPDKYSTIDQLLTGTNDHAKPDVRDLLIKTYGDQGITGFLKLTGALNNAGSSDQVEYFEEGRRHRKIAYTARSGSSTAVFTVGADNAGVDPLFEASDVLLEPVSGVRFIVKSTVTDVAADGDSDPSTITCVRMDAKNFATSDVAATGELVHIGNIYGQGTDQPTKFQNPDVVRRKNPFMIIKDRFQVNGSQATNIGYINIGNGDYRWFMYGEQEARKRFEDKREMMMLLAEQHNHANANVAVAGEDVAGSEGYFAAIEARGLNVTGANTSPMTLSNFDDIIIELDKQGAPAEYAMYLNRKQDLAIDDMLAAGIATQVTAGLSGQFGAFNNDADLAVKLGFKSFTRGGYTFHKHDWKLLNDPQLLAGGKYQGAMIPMSQVADARSGVKSPALEMNYKASNGYSREMEHWVTGGGIMGHTNGDAGKDVMTFHYRSEINLITRAANQHVLIRE